MKVYHGSDSIITTLATGSYVTRAIKDAWKFGYRRAVVNGSQTVYIYEAEVKEGLLAKDPNRDRAYITIQELDVKLDASAPVWDAPCKLGTFKPGQRKPGRRAD